MIHVKSNLQEFKPDIIHVATPFNIGLCGIHYAKKLNIPLVGSYHTDFDQYLDYYDLQFLSPLLWKYMKWFHRSFLRTFIPSEQTKEKLMRNGFTDLHIWSRGVDSTLYRPNKNSTNVRARYKIKEKYILSYVGRLAPEKDITTLIETMKSLPLLINKEIRWLIVGDGPSKADMQKETPANVTFTGYLKEKQISQKYMLLLTYLFFLHRQKLSEMLCQKPLLVEPLCSGQILAV